MNGRRHGASWLGRGGMAIPLIVCFVLLIGIFIANMTFTRYEVKRQTKTTFEYLAAHYMAQAALQHAQLKLRLLPNEAYDASSVSTGYCPFFIGTATQSALRRPQPLDVFFADVTTEPPTPPGLQTYPLDGALNSFGAEGWGYKVVRGQAVTAFTSATLRVLVLELEAEGQAVGWTEKDGEQPRIERIRKTIEIKRQK